MTMLPDDENERYRDEMTARLATVADEMTEAARKLGLYEQRTEIAVPPRDEADHGARAVIQQIYLIGDHAFSDAVQRPEAARDKSAVAQMEVSSVDADVEAIRRQYVEDDDES